MSFDRQPDVPRGSEPTPSVPPPSRAIARCPQCGGTHIRKRARPLVVSLVACVVCLPLTMLLCATVPGLLLALLALPVMTCIALVGRNRCLDCGHRFDPNHRDAGTVVQFPWRFHVLNILILVVLCVLGPHVMAIRAGAERLPDMMEDIGIFMRLTYLLWGSLLWHLALYFSLRRRIAHPLIWAILFVLPGIWGGTKVFYRSLPNVRASALLAYAGLAPLPESATGIRIYTWSSPFSGEDFLRFTAAPEDVERFVSESPALRGQEPTRFSRKHMRLEYPRDHLGNLAYRQDGNTYFLPHSGKPTWYKQEIRGPARTYIVQPPRYQLPGEVLVDDETNTVYVYLCFS